MLGYILVKVVIHYRHAVVSFKPAKAKARTL